MSNEQPQPQPGQEPQPDQREWIPVPPPHPYATSTAAPAGRPQQSGKALAISAMALGLIALFSAVVCAFYFNLFVVAAALVGVVALVLGVVALVKGSRPKGASITGLISGTLAVLIAVAVGAAGAFTLFFNLVMGGEGEPSLDGGPTTTEEWQPETSPEPLLHWPSNMATGGIVFTGPGAPLPLESEPLSQGTSPSPHSIDRESIADVLIYVDYRCPHCMMFEQTNGELLERLIDSGDATIEIVPLSFLDRASEGAYYSSRAAGAVACLADSQPEGAWAGHRALLDPSVQPGSGLGLSNDELVSVLDDAVGGLNPAAKGCIESEQFASFAQALNQWVFANPVPNANDTESRLTGTPSVFVNGEFYAGATDDAAAFEEFYQEQTR